MRNVSTATIVMAVLLTGEVWAGEKPVKIYVFAGQSNMEARYPRKFPEENHPELVKEENVWSVQGPDGGPIAEAGGFGVDRAMVYRIVEEVDQPIIVFRGAVGGKTLNKDFRPPSAVSERAPVHQGNRGVNNQVNSHRARGMIRSFTQLSWPQRKRRRVGLVRAAPE